MTGARLLRARFDVALNTGHDVTCAMAFSGRLRGQQATTRARLPIDPCLCAPRGPVAAPRGEIVERRPSLIACSGVLPPASFGEALGQRIEDSGLTINELARRVGISKHSIYHWRAGRAVPAPAYRTALRVALGLDADADGGWWRSDWS